MSKLVEFFFQLTIQIKLYHWMTLSYSRHKASDELYQKILDLSDKFMEVYIGKYGRPKMTSSANSANTISYTPMNDTNIIHYLKKTNDFLTNTILKHLHGEKDTDLLNIRDELLAAINQTIYLFTLD